MRPKMKDIQNIGYGTTAASAEYLQHKVLRNTYALLSSTLLFSAMMAGLSMVFNLPHPGIIITLVGYFGLLYLTAANRNSGMGLVFVFLLTGFMGYTLGPVVSSYLALANGGLIVTKALATTALIFIALSAYVLITGKNLSFMGGFLMAGILVGFVGGLAALLFDIPALSLAISVVFVLLMSGLIMYETSNIIHDGETNYIMATVTLFVAIYNLFTSLLMLLGFYVPGIGRQQANQSFFKYEVSIMSLQNLITQFTGNAPNASHQAGGGDSDNPLEAIKSAIPGGLAGGIAAGGVMALLMGNKSARKLAGKAAAYGGTALLGGLAYKGYQNWKQNQSLDQTAPINRSDIEKSQNVIPASAGEGLPSAAPYPDQGDDCRGKIRWAYRRQGTEKYLRCC